MAATRHRRRMEGWKSTPSRAWVRDDTCQVLAYWGTLGNVESCYLFVVIDGVVARELQGTCRQGGEVAHAAARYNFSRYGNFLYKRLVRHTIWRHITYASRPHECRVMVAMVTFRLASARGVTFGMDRFGRSSTATHLLQRTVHSRSNEHCMHTVSMSTLLRVRRYAPVAPGTSVFLFAFREVRVAVAVWVSSFVAQLY